MKLAGIIRRMEMEIRAAQLIDNTWRDAETVEKELSTAMRVLLRFAYEAGQEGASTLDKTAARIPQVKALLEQLRAVQWVSGHGSGPKVCPCCRGTYPEHQSDCARQAALAPFKDSR